MLTGKQQLDLKKMYPEIAAMTVTDVLNSEEFKESFKKALNVYRPAGSAFHAFNSLKKDGFMELDKFKKEYIACMDRQSNLPFAKRVVMFSIGNNAYAFTIKRMMKDYDNKKKKDEKQ